MKLNGQRPTGEARWVVIRPDSVIGGGKRGRNSRSSQGMAVTSFPLSPGGYMEGSSYDQFKQNDVNTGVRQIIDF